MKKFLKILRTRAKNEIVQLLFFLIKNDCLLSGMMIGAD